MNNFQEMLKRELNEKLTYVQAGLMEESNYHDWLYTFFLKHKNKEVLHKRKTQGSSALKLDELLAKVAPTIGKPIFSHKNTHDSIRSDFIFLDTKENKYFAEVTKSSSVMDDVNSYNITIWAEDEKFADDFVNNLKSIFEITKSDKIYVISSNRNGLALNSLGKLNYTFIRDNYEDKVLDSYDHIVKEFNKITPYGRLSIINGPPGSGKTNFLKGLTSELKNSLIVLLPSKFVSEIDSPNIITLLTNEKQNMYGTFYEEEEEEFEKNKQQSSPIQFIIEDADECLVPRGGSNVSTISSLLNYTDGIFGSMLDLRIIATTNAEKMQFDDALLRPGRLCRQITIDGLSPEKAMSVYKRLSGGKTKTYTKKATLAEIYADVNGGFKDAEVEKQGPVGFGT